MARHRSFLTSVIRAARVAEKRRAADERHRIAETGRRERERARQIRQQAALTKQQQREAEREYIRQEEQEAARRNSDLEQQKRELGSLLLARLSAAGPLNFQMLKRKAEIPEFQPGKLAEAEAAPLLDNYVPPPASVFSLLWPPAKRAHAEAAAAAVQRYNHEMAKHAEREDFRKRALADARFFYEQKVEKLEAEAAEWNRQVDQFEEEYTGAKPKAVAEYCQLVLEQSDYPDGFPNASRIAYVPESKQLVVEYELPTLDVVPDVATYKYVKSKDEIVTTACAAAQRRAGYVSVIAQTTLRTLHEVFCATQSLLVESIVFNGHVSAIDKGTGQQIHPCIITVRVTRDVFTGLSLANVEPQACLKTLSASVSPNPTELSPVRPVLEFNMVDPRFVQEADVLTTLDQRPNLMELTPTEFESLITNLFEKMGLETRQTQASRDGGVDCVAYDTRPIFGGKVIIQAKRYKNTVGVSAVRDLFGTLQNEGASKGILVTTSGYGKAAFEFADGKPLELLSGNHLLYLLDQHAGVKAKIEVPEAWHDPVHDSPDP